MVLSPEEADAQEEFHLERTSKMVNSNMLRYKKLLLTMTFCHFFSPL